MKLVDSLLPEFEPTRISPLLVMSVVELAPTNWKLTLPHELIVPLLTIVLVPVCVPVFENTKPVYAF